MKICTVVGARPQFVKAATVSRALLATEGMREVMIHTGQHYDHAMSSIFFSELGIAPPAHQLSVGGGSHGAMTGRQMEKVEEILIAEKPDLVLVYGDTNSTLAGALSAAKLNIPLAHVEAGLRSFNRTMPEEVNRVLTDHVSSLLYAPTATAVENLAREGLVGDKVVLVGDVMYDAVLHYRGSALRPEAMEAQPDSPFALCTIHRAGNTDDPERLREIMKGLAMCHLRIVLPLHPRTRGKLSECGIVLGQNIKVIDPVGYLEMIWLESNCELVITDSGGVQKEAYFHGKPCVTLREETEWVELVDAGVNRLVQASAVDVRDAVAAALSVRTEFVSGLYGNGDAAQLIVQSLAAFLDTAPALARPR